LGAANKAAGVTATRFDAPDRLRGLIMVLMAIDHASYFIARVHPAETWAYPPPYYATSLAFWTRWITHLCAPGFFLLMGASMSWFAASRTHAGWSTGQIARYFVTRGLLLLGGQHFVENPAWAVGTLSAAAGRVPEPPTPGGSGEFYLSFAVITALGGALIFWSWLVSARAIVVAAIGAAAMAASMWATPSPEHATNAYSVPMRLLFVPGRTGIVQVMYAVVPWLVPVGAGVLLGRALSRRPTGSAILTATLGGALVAVFVVLRAAGLGEYHPAEPGLIGFLTVTKYPPSLDFLALMLGLDLLLLSLFFVGVGGRLARPLEVFGRTPLFFYLLHLYVFAALSWAFRQGTTFAVMYLVWAVAVIAMYPICRRYAAFKAATPITSRWRLF
jgi:uncharacterized membrane protein